MRWVRDFCPALAALVGPVQNTFSPNGPNSSPTPDYRRHHRVPLHTEKQRPLSGVYSIMMEKLARLVRVTAYGVHAHPLILYLPSRTKLHAVYAPAERAETLPLLNLPLYVLCGRHGRSVELSGYIRWRASTTTLCQS